MTGGGGLFWDESQLGWEVVADRNTFPEAGDAQSFYELMCQGVINALRTMGVEAAFRPKNDIEIHGRKISGTGGTNQGQSFLFQGTLLVDFDVETMLRALRIPAEKLKDKEIDSIRERVTCLASELGVAPPIARIKEHVTAGFAELFGVDFSQAPLSSLEEELLSQRLPFYQSEDWIYGTRHALDPRSELQAMHKCPGGLIRVSLLLQANGRRIREAFITGDFFAHPKRAIHDLEAALKGIPATPDAVSALVDRFFASGDVAIPGVSACDFELALCAALDKRNYVRLGIPIDSVNEVFSVAKPLAEVPLAPLLLLPYCAKSPSCEYRYQDGCARCGACSIGEAYDLADRYGLQVVCIQNYEMLEETLLDARRRGVPSFVGSCCEAFVAKHRDDFERIGLPGILVDIDDSTCYDLGEDTAAHAGRFERQTGLKLELLERVLELGTEHAV